MDNFHGALTIFDVALLFAFLSSDDILLNKNNEIIKKKSLKKCYLWVRELLDYLQLNSGTQVKIFDNLPKLNDSNNYFSLISFH